MASVEPRDVCQKDCDAWYDGGGQRWCVGVWYCLDSSNGQHCTSASERCRSCSDVC